MDSSTELLQRSLEELHLRQQKDERMAATDRSDGRADAEPSTRVSAPAPSAGQHRQVLPSPLPRIQKEGFGFRPQSGTSTPVTTVSTASPLPDPNGLGWPGEPPSHAVTCLTQPGTRALTTPPPRCKCVASQINCVQIERDPCRACRARAEDGLGRADHPRMYRRRPRPRGPSSHPRSLRTSSAIPDTGLRGTPGRYVPTSAYCALPPPHS
jgi:hypothetical protein